MNKHFNERQRKMLQDALDKRREKADNAGLSTPTAKRKVSQEEYRRRMQEMMVEDQRVTQETQKRRIAEALEDWKRIAGPRFAESTIENPRVHSLVMAKVDRIQNHGPLHRNSLVLSGKLGVGKTWTAYAYARELVSRGILLPSSLVHGTESSLLTPLAVAGFERPAKVFKFLNSNNKFYIIDEVGRSNIRPEIRHEIWYEIVNHAYENHVPLVITTNKSTASYKVMGSDRVTNELEEWIGEAAYDRLKHIADVVIPSEENKRAQVGKLMDEGKVLGLEEPEEEVDPFGDPVRKATPSRNNAGSQGNSNQGIRRSSTKLQDKDLRPRRRSS